MSGDHTHRFTRTTSPPQKALEGRTKAPGAPSRVPQPRRTPVQNHAEELEDHGAPNLVSQSEAAAPKLRQEAAEENLARAPAVGDHVPVVDVGRHHRRSLREGWLRLPAATKNLLGTHVRLRVIHRLRDGVVAEVKGPGPAHGHPSEAELEFLRRLRGDGAADVIVVDRRQARAEIVADLRALAAEPGPK